MTKADRDDALALMEVDDESGIHDTVYEDAVTIMKTNPNGAAAKFRSIIFTEGETTPEQMRVLEASIYRLSECLVQLGDAHALRQLIVDLRVFFDTTSKAKTAKIVRKIIDYIGEIPNCAVLQAEICQEAIDWCQTEKRTMLRQRLESRLATYYLALQRYKEALLLINTLIVEVKKLDDKLLLVEILLIESRIHHALENVPKAKAALTSARAASNAIYCPPVLQAEIDRQAGVLCAEENDFKTAFSYFYECFESYNTVSDARNAVAALKYMLLSKIMSGETSDVYAILHGKSGVKYAGVEVESLMAVAEAHKKRSLKDFENVLIKYKTQLEDDAVIGSHIKGLYEKLLEQNLIRILDPFSVVQITHVAKLIQLPIDRVQGKLSEMILDEKFDGILDQGAGNLILYESADKDVTYDTALQTIKELNVVTDCLYDKARRLTHH